MNRSKEFDFQWVAWAGLAALLLYQAWLYYYRLPLSLGPRVIFEPWALRNGFVLYENITDLHPPLMPWLLTVLGYLVPNGLRLARLALVGLASLTTLLVFLAARRQSGSWAGLAAAGLFALWAPTYGFYKLWYEAFLAPAYLVYILGFKPSDQPRSPRWWIFWGLFGGLTVLIKQHAALVFAAFLVWEGITALNNKRPWRTILRDVVLTGLFSFIPLALALGYQAIRAGTMEGMLFWIVRYPFLDVYTDLASQPITATQQMNLIEVGLLLLPALLWLGVLIRKKEPSWREIGLWACVLLTGGLTVFPRFEMYHLLPALPVLVLFSVWILSTVLRSAEGALARSFAIGVALTVGATWLVGYAPLHLNAITTPESRQINEYSELENLAEQIRQTAGQPESMYIFVDDEGTANLYYLLDCLPPRYWIFHYPWYMLDEIKTDILDALEESPPEWVVFRPDAWHASAYAPEIIEYIESNYHKEAPLSFSAGQIWLMRRNADRFP